MSDQLDQEVAERVLGWKRPTREFEPWDTMPNTFPGSVLVSRNKLPRFSEDVGEAWRIVERAEYCAMTHDVKAPHRAWVQLWIAGRMGQGQGDSMAEAICRAALAVVPQPSKEPR